MAYRVVKSENINGKKNIYTYEGTGTKPEGDHIAENSKLTDLSQGKVYYYDPTKADGSKWQPLKASEGGLPADFPAEGIANANKFLGFDANGDYTAKDAPSGGGAEKFVVTLTQDAQTEEWTAADGITIADIVAAYAANQVCVAKFVEDHLGIEIEVPIISAVQSNGMSAAIFSCVFSVESPNAIMAVISGVNMGEADAWTLDSIEPNHVPSYSSSNNGQVLGVDDGAPAWVDSNAPLIVTFAFDDPSDPTAFVGDKTYGEVFTAASAGIPCTLVLSAGGASVATPVLSAVSSSGTIMLFTYDTDSSSITSIQGSGSDYVTLAIS